MTPEILKLKEQISSILAQKPVSDSTFPIGTYGRIAVYDTAGIGYTIQAFFKDEMQYSVTDFEYSVAVHKFMKVFEKYNKIY